LGSAAGSATALARQIGIIESDGVLVGREAQPFRHQIVAGAKLDLMFVKHLKKGGEWRGGDAAEIQKAAFACSDSKLVGSHLQVNLLDRPGMTISA